MWEAPLLLSVQSNFPKWAWTSQILCLGGSSQYHTVLFFLGNRNIFTFTIFSFSQSNIYFGFDIFIVIKLFRVFNLVFQCPVAVITIAARADQTAPSDTFPEISFIAMVTVHVVTRLPQKAWWLASVCMCVYSAVCNRHPEQRVWPENSAAARLLFKMELSRGSNNNYKVCCSLLPRISLTLEENKSLPVKLGPNSFDFGYFIPNPHLPFFNSICTCPMCCSLA